MEKIIGVGVIIVAILVAFTMLTGWALYFAIVFLLIIGIAIVAL